MAEKIEPKKRAKKIGKTVQSSQLYKWSFTLNNYKPEDILHLKLRLNKLCKRWIFGEEIGKKAETPHLQGQFSLIKKLRLTALKKWDTRIHWEATRNVDASEIYCRKEGKYYTNIEFEDFDEYKKVTWRPWQQKVIKKVEQECDKKREINWIYDKNGNTGKSMLTRYLALAENALIVDGKKSDIMHQIAKRCEEGLRIGTVIVDLPRASSNNISYSAIEAIKNGFVSSGKYEGGQYSFQTPHVYVFANEPPEKNKMSLDRWNISNIEPEDDVFE